MEALASAYHPAQLAPELNHALIRNALEDPLRPANQEELAASERFRQALAGVADHPDLELAKALAVSHGGTPPSDIEAINARTLDKALNAATPASTHRPSNVVFMSFGVAGVLGAAAAILLLLISPKTEQDQAASLAPASVGAAPALAQSRSSSHLFAQKFEPQGTTERVDLIASVRARELRANRFKQWGVSP
jgi:hypothetical protein